MSQVIYQLSSDNLTFPPPEHALTEPNGLLAFDGDLSVERLIQAYSQGIFPWYSNNEPIMWWSPNPRAIIPIANLRVNKTLKKVIRRETFTITVNKAFQDVIALCANAPFRRDGTWIIDEMQQAYINLHHAGFAHSIEVWQQNELIGGLYGVAINGYFSGESMFYVKNNGSKLALLGLAAHLKHFNVDFIDCQMQNQFLASMGTIEINREHFLAKHQQALSLTVPENIWQQAEISLSDYT